MWTWIVFLAFLCAGYNVGRFLIKRGVSYVWSFFVLLIVVWLVYFFLQAIDRVMCLRGI